jgi:amino acid transporter
LQPRFQLRFSFAIISVLTGVTTTYNTGLCYGGPVVSMTLGWLVVAAFNGCVTLSTAEICSAYPTSGGLYYWSAKLAGKDWAPLASWVTGWYVFFPACPFPGCYFFSVPSSSLTPSLSLFLQVQHRGTGTLECLIFK